MFNLIHRWLKNAVCIRYFNVNYNNTPSVLYPTVLHSQMSVNKYNPTCGMCYCRMCFVLFLMQLIWPRKFYLVGDMKNLCSFIQGSLEWEFSELFFSDVSLRNQYKCVAFNIFSCRVLIISYKMLIITAISNETNICMHISRQMHVFI